MQLSKLHLTLEVSETEKSVYNFQNIKRNICVMQGS